MTTPNKRKLEDDDNENKPGIFSRLFSTAKRAKTSNFDKPDPTVNPSETPSLPRINLSSKLDKASPQSDTKEEKKSIWKSPVPQTAQFSIGSWSRPTWRTRRVPYKPPARSLLEARRIIKQPKRQTTDEYNVVLAQRILRQNKSILDIDSTASAAPTMAVGRRRNPRVSRMPPQPPPQQTASRRTVTFGASGDDNVKAAPQPRLQRTQTPYFKKPKSEQSAPVIAAPSPSVLEEAALPPPETPRLIKFHQGFPEFNNSTKQPTTETTADHHINLPFVLALKDVTATTLPERELGVFNPSTRKIKKAKKKQENATSVVVAKPATTSSGDEYKLDNFWGRQQGWKCPKCLVMNAESVGKCSCCGYLKEEAKPAADASSSKPPASDGPKTDPRSSIGPKGFVVQSASTGKSVFKFGGAFAASGSSGLKFGASQGGASNPPSVGGFTFGQPPKPTSGFSFGKKKEEGSPAPNVASTAAPPLNTAAKPFTFGAPTPPPAAVVNPPATARGTTSISATGSSVPNAAPAKKPGFSFSSQAPNAVSTAAPPLSTAAKPFTFGAPTPPPPPAAVVNPPATARGTTSINATGSSTPSAAPAKKPGFSFSSQAPNAAPTVAPPLNAAAKPFTFGAAAPTAAVAANPPATGGNTTSIGVTGSSVPSAAPNKVPGFSFGSSSSNAVSTPSFSFAASSSAASAAPNAAAADKPGFSFGASASSAVPTGAPPLKADVKPFTFGAGASTTATNPPAAGGSFPFGSNAGPSQAFGSTPASGPTPTPPQFGAPPPATAPFGQPNPAQGGFGAPTGGFGNNQFGTPGPTPAPGFGFGNGGAPAPSFGGAPAFGTPSTTTPGFGGATSNFGAQTPASRNFGAGASGFGAPPAGVQGAGFSIGSSSKPATRGRRIVRAKRPPSNRK